MRLIDADALNKVLGFAEPCADCEHVYGTLLCADVIWRDVCDAIYEAPTVDAEPVRHGKWEGFGEGYARCSECGETTPWLYASDYCGHCGAKMEEDDETD